jgi:hypothetical protein
MGAMDETAGMATNETWWEQWRAGGREWVDGE